MKYVVLINLGPGARNWQTLPAAQQAEVQAAWGELNKTPGVTPGLGLQPPESATTVRIEHGETLITDGPYVETKEALDGFFTLEAADLDAAIEVANMPVPGARSWATACARRTRGSRCRP